MEELYTLDELSKLLKVPKSWIYQRTMKNEIPFLKLGKYLRFRKNDIEEWIKEGSD